MKKYILASTTLAILSVFATGFLKKGPINQPQGFAVIELFTSEGCSSCPPAEALVEDIAQHFQNNVYILAYHVDYWNYLGWKDAFSNTDYSNRQKQYASALNLQDVYTPQIIVNGKTELVGSDRNKLLRVLGAQLKGPEGEPINVEAKNLGDNKISVALHVKDITGKLVNIALVQLQAESQVSRGENSGKTLRHIDLVRAFQTLKMPSAESNTIFTGPIGVKSSNLRVVAFLQDKTSMAIEGVGGSTIQ